ncbi:MAG: hypothetical protein ABIH28_00885 [archaeon]
MKKETNFLTSKKTTAFFAIISLIGGFSFLNKNITGKIILEDAFSFDLISLIGLLLILCSIILGVYSLKKKGD